MYYLHIILLVNCPYSIKLHDLLKQKKIHFQHIWVPQNEKEKYKTEKIKTFPQVYLKSLSNNDSLLLGGCDFMTDLINNLNNEKIFENLTKDLSNKTKIKLKLILNGHNIINYN
jgi:glutaredoxin